MMSSLMGLLALLPLLLLLVVITKHDVSRRRIPNRLVLIGILVGLFFNGLLPGGMGFNSSTTGGVGWLGGLQGAVVGMAVLLPIYWIKALGAGDVKLMGMIGAFLGTTDVLGVVLATFIVGGAMALVVAFCSRRLFVLLQNIKFMLLDSMVNIGIGHPPLMNDLPVSVGKLPYAVAISLGTFTYLIWQRL